MITLVNGLPQGPDSLIVPLGSISFQLNVDGEVIAPPYGFVSADKVVVFQFNAAGVIQPNPPNAAAQIYSNLELNPQNSIGLGTYYLVTFYDQNGARINTSPMWWQFQNAANSTVDIGSMTPYFTEGNVIFYPLISSFATPPGGASTDVQINLAGVFYGDSGFTYNPITQIVAASIFNATTGFTVSGAAPAGQFLRGNGTNFVAATIQPGDVPSGTVTWDQIGNAAGPLVLHNGASPTTFDQTDAAVWTWANLTAATSILNQSSPSFVFAGQAWNGSASVVDQWTIQPLIGAGTNPQSQLFIGHTGPGPGGVMLAGTLSTGNILANAIDAFGHVSLDSAAATNLVNVSSFPVLFNGAWWNGSVSVLDSTTIVELISAGVTPTSVLTISNSGAFSWGGVSIIGALKSQTLTITAATPTGTAGQVSFGTTTATSATAGTNGDVPAQVFGYLTIDIAGTKFKIPYYNV